MDYFYVDIETELGEMLTYYVAGQTHQIIYLLTYRY